jgi:hypothetical protein
MRWVIVSAVSCSICVFCASTVAGRGKTTVDDLVVVRVQGHFRPENTWPVQVVAEHDLPGDIWSRVRHLVAFRIHRHGRDGATRVDPQIYLLRTSELYQQAAAVLRQSATTREYVWCQLAAVVAHEAAHTAPLTERQALTAEVAQLRRCLFAGHLHAKNGWNGVAYLGKVEARLRNPREHY